MATTQTRPYIANADIKLEYGAPQVFALKFAEGKSVESRYPGGRVMFTALDERKLFLDDEDANDLERAMRDLGLGVADFMKVTKIRHARGGGHSIRVERVADPADGERDNAPAWVRDGGASGRDPDMRHPAVRMPAQTREEALLEKSVEMARERGAGAFQRTPSRVSPEPPPAPAAATNNSDHTAGAAIFTTDAAPMLAAMCAAVDAIVETQAYAQRRGLGVTFSEESVRAIGLSIYIGNQRSGGR
jgi:hypothetical protein